ncbi:MAG: DUF1987 domain-containing protein [Bacteroidales bacterium]|jgi:hypothetical protein
MKKLYIKPGHKSPEIYFSPEENIFTIIGNSAPEDVRALYYPVTEWIKLFVDDILEGEMPEFTKENPVRFQICLSYFNSSSAKFLYDILNELKRLALDELITVEWQYDESDTDMMDAGKDMAELAGISFRFVPVSK